MGVVPCFLAQPKGGRGNNGATIPFLQGERTPLHPEQRRELRAGESGAAGGALLCVPIPFLSPCAHC